MTKTFLPREEHRAAPCRQHTFWAGGHAPWLWGNPFLEGSRVKDMNFGIRPGLSPSPGSLVWVVSSDMRPWAGSWTVGHILHE